MHTGMLREIGVGLSWISLLAAMALLPSQIKRMVMQKKYKFQKTLKGTSSEAVMLGEMGFKVSFMEQLYERYWRSSGLDKALLRLPKESLIVVSVLLGILMAYEAIRAYQIPLVGVSGFVIGVLIPFECIDLYKVYEEHKMLRQLPMLFGVLLRWAHINEDPIYCLNKLADSGLSKEIILPYIQFCLSYQSGTSLEVSRKQLEIQSKLKITKHFSICLEQLMRQRGNVIKLFEAFEEEAYQLQQEEIKRKMTRVYYKILIKGLSVCSFFIMHELLKSNRVLSSFYIDSPWGQNLLGLISLCGVGIFLSGFKYDQSEVY